MSGPYVLLYDRDCGICSALSRWIHRVDVRGRIRFESIQSGRALLTGIPDERMLDAWHIVTPDGHVTTGGDAVPTLVSAFPIGAGLGRLLAGSSGLMRQGPRPCAVRPRVRGRVRCRPGPGPAAPGACPRRGGRGRGGFV